MVSAWIDALDPTMVSAWFNALDPTAQAAVIIGAVTLLSTAINFLSNILNNHYNYAARRHERLLERRAESIQELLLALDRLYGDASRKLFELWNLHSEFAKALETASESGSHEELQRCIREMDALDKTIVKDGHDQLVWFDNDIGRLTIWLEEPKKIREQLRKLRDLHSQIARMMDRHLMDSWETFKVFDTEAKELSEVDRNRFMHNVSLHNEKIMHDTSNARADLEASTTSVSQALLRLLK
jgi:hypothetical protein